MIKGGNAQENMFDGMPDQFYHFLASTSRSSSSSTTTTSSLPLPLSFSLHHHHHHHHGGSFASYPPPPPPPPPPSFDSPPFPLSPPPHLLHHHHQPQLFPFDQLHQSSHAKHHAKEEAHHHVTVPPSGIDPNWSNDEVLALLRIRSSVDTNWFPDFTWENVSRKLGELGFKRSAEKCKEKFEEETRSFNNNIIINNCNNNKNIITNNYRLFGEFEDLYNTNSDHHHETPPPQPPPPPSDPDHDEANGHDPDTSSTPRKRNQQSPQNGQNEEEQIEEEEEEDKTGQEKLLLGDDKVGGDDQSQSVNDSQQTEENTKRVMKKRKRQKKFEMLKGFCEGVVNKMMAQQEELHSKILQDMVKRDEEKTAKEEAWKKQENERILKEMEVRARELSVAGDRQAKLLDILDKFTSSNSLDVQLFGEALEDLVKVPNTLSNSKVLAQDCSMIRTQQPTSSCGNYHQSPCSLVNQNCQIDMPTSSLNCEDVACQSSSGVDNSKLALPMSSSSTDQLSQNPNPAMTENDHTSTDATDFTVEFRSLENQANAKPNVENKIKDDTGRRWPRDEVLALINIRCNLLNNNGDHSQHDTKGPLWERISQKMLEVGYKRSAKRCKEKWENINKYFRKTKDLNKKRSIDSRTCPYFHQLSHLYSQGTQMGPTDRSTNRSSSPEGRSMALQGVEGGSSTSNRANTAMHDSQGNQGLVQTSAFDFEF